MLQTYLGEIAALLASFCFSIGPTLNTLAGQRVSVPTLNRVRLSATLLLLVIPHWITQGSLFPLNASPENWFFLALSGITHLVIGDVLLFSAFNAIGTRLSMLVSSLIPVFSSLMAWFLLDEKLAAVQVTGILVTLTGIIWVVLGGRGEVGKVRDRRVYLRGLLLALCASFFLALSTIFAKRGMGTDFPALSAHMLRTLVALVLVSAPMLKPSQARRTLQELRSRPDSLRFVLWGAVFGPLLGMWLSLVAIQNTNIGIATAITSLPPIWLLPVGRYFFKEKIGLSAVIGSVVAVTGVAVIFLF